MQRRCRSIAAAVALICLAGPPDAPAGTITGRVELIEKKGRIATDHSDVVVYVDGLPSAVTPTRTTIDMRRKTFEPRLVVVPVGSTVEFPNSDPIFHNVFSVSGENRFDLELYQKPESRAAHFEHPGIVKVYCNVHPQMSAIVVVRDNPYHARAQADGSFRIENVPAGTRQLRAWHERAGDEAPVEIEVPATGEVTVNLSLDSSRFRKRPHKNKHGKDYPLTDEPY